VAHEINNPMGGILAFAQLLMRDKSLDEGVLTYVREIEESAQRCRKIVQGLLEFSRSAPTDEQTDVDINSVVEKALFLVEHTVGKHKAEIRRGLSVGLPKIRANANQLQQVVVNLITNACGAIEGTGGVNVRTGEGPAEIWIEVEDDGVGISEADSDKVFVPFFTTKPQGEGTGLGLAVSLGIIESHGGTLTFESAPGKGTVFRVSLPARRSSWPGLGPMP
jgi:two-component system NtrC family sensor kinase